MRAALSRMCSELIVVAERDYWLIDHRIRRKSDFVEALMQGNAVCAYIQTHVPYADDMDILDVGCADGCVAAAFARQGHRGIYAGFDIKREWIDSLNAIFVDHPNFRFEYFDLYHSYYNPDGAAKPEEFEFPPGNYDLILLNSVFSHMTMPSIEKYLENCALNLKDSGLVWCTLLVIGQDFARGQLQPPYDEHYVEYKGSISFSPRKPELLIAQLEDRVLDAIGAAGLGLHRRIDGYWKGRRTSLDQHDQDVFILKKRN